MTSLTELFLYLASRAQHVEELIRPSIESGKIAISDRFGDASIAYQGGGRRLPGAEIERLNRFATRELNPDLTVLIDLSPEIGLDRVAKDMKRAVDNVPEKDRIERENLEFHRRVREAYLEQARREQSRFIVLDGRGSPDTLHLNIQAEVLDRLEKNRIDK